MDQKTEDYAARAANASPLELLMMNYELAVYYLNDARDALSGGDCNAFKKYAEGARDYLNLLMTSLDMEYAISKELMRIYIYINGLIIKAETSKSPDFITTAADMLSKLADSYRALDKPDDKNQPQNAQTVYAGLTYKNGKLTEYVEEDAGRGFKA